MRCQILRCMLLQESRGWYPATCLILQHRYHFDVAKQISLVGRNYSSYSGAGELRFAIIFNCTTKLIFLCYQSKEVYFCKNSKTNEEIIEKVQNISKISSLVDMFFVSYRECRFTFSEQTEKEITHWQKGCWTNGRIISLPQTQRQKKLTPQSWKRWVSAQFGKIM